MEMAKDYLAMALAEVDRLQKELTAAQKRTREAQDEEARLVQLLSAWEIIVANTPRNGGHVGRLQASAEPLPVMPPIARASEESNSYGQKINAIREIFRDNPEHGFDPAELWRLAQNKEITDRRGLIYTSLAKLNKKGEITKRRGKYYAAAALLGVDTAGAETPTKIFTLQ